MDIILDREVYILVSDEKYTFFPSDTRYPSNTLYAKAVNECKNIIAGTLRLEERVADSSIVFGAVYSSMFEVQLYGGDDLTGKRITVYKRDDIDGVLNTSQIFDGFVDSCKFEGTKQIRTLVAYDELYFKRNCNVAEWWTTYWDGRVSSDLLTLFQSLIDNVGMQLGNYSGCKNTDYIISKKPVDFTAVSFESMLKMICELMGAFPHINRATGALDLLTFKDTEPVSIEDYYELGNSSFEEYAVQGYTGIQFYAGNDELVYTYRQSTNSYPITENIFLYNATSEDYANISSNLWLILSCWNTVTSASISMIMSSFDYNLLDRVSTDNGSIYILANVYSGAKFVNQTISAPNPDFSGGTTPPINTESMVLNRKVAIVRQNLEEFSVDYREFKSNVESDLQITEEHYATLTQTVNGITTRVGNVETSLANNYSTTTEVNSAIGQSASDIRLSVTQTLQSYSTTSEMNSAIDLAVNGITLSASNNGNESTLTLKAGETTLSSANVKITGFVTFASLETSGQTTINGDNITTGKLKNANNDNNYWDLDSGKLKATEAEFNNCAITGGSIHQEKFVSEAYGNAWFDLSSAELMGGYTNIGQNSIDFSATQTVEGTRSICLHLEGDGWIRLSGSQGNILSGMLYTDDEGGDGQTDILYKTYNGWCRAWYLPKEDGNGVDNPPQSANPNAIAWHYVMNGLIIE